MAAASKRFRVGIVATELDSEYMRAMFDGVCRCAAALGVDLVVYTVQRSGAVDIFNKQFGIAYKFVDTSELDGLLVFGATLQSQCDDPEALAAQLVKRFAPFPCVAVGCVIPGWPAVTCSSYSGFKQLVEHLIAVHGHRHIAMIEGPASSADAQDRLRAYLDALREAGIKPDPRLRVKGMFSTSTGGAAMKELLQRGVPFDALVCANDAMAWGALAVALERGMSVPGDLAIGGTDDLRSFGNIGPSLTSVNQGIHDQAQAALAMLLERIAGRVVEPQVQLESRLVLRRSCGCMGGHAGARHDGAALPTPAHELLADLGVPPGLLAAVAEKVLALREALVDKGAGRQSRAVLIDLFHAWREHQLDGDRLQDLLLGIQERLLGHLSLKDLALASERLQQALVLLSNTSELLSHLESATIKNDVNLHLQFRPRVTSDDLDALLAGLGDGLKQLGIETCFVALYGNPTSLEEANTEGLPDTARLVFALDAGVLYPQWCGQDFATRELVPHAAASRRRAQPRALQMFPMFHLNLHFGFIVLERKSRTRFPYEELRHEISGSLRHSLLVKELDAARELLRLDLERAKAANETLSHIAMRDAMTGLFNRRGFLQLAESVMRTARLTGQAMGLVFADMDGLKQINDAHGHEEGDAAICQAGLVLQQAFRQEDIVARIGGDEFVALTRSGAPDTLSTIEQRVGKRFAEHNATSSKPYTLGCSLGSYLVQADSAESLDEILSHADRMMYAEKRRKRSQRSLVALGG